MSAIVVDPSPWVPEGVYLLRYISYETTQYWGHKKMAVHFAIVEGEYAGTPLTRYYNVKERVTDRFAVVREHRALFPDESNCSQIDPNTYSGHLIRARVETTRKSGIGKELTQASRYSVVRELLEIVPDDYVPEES